MQKVFPFRLASTATALFVVSNTMASLLFVQAQLAGFSVIGLAGDNIGSG